MLGISTGSWPQSLDALIGSIKVANTSHHRWKATWLIVHATVHSQFFQWLKPPFFGLNIPISGAFAAKSTIFFWGSTCQHPKWSKFQWLKPPFFWVSTSQVLQVIQVSVAKTSTKTGPKLWSPAARPDPHPAARPRRRTASGSPAGGGDGGTALGRPLRAGMMGFGNPRKERIGTGATTMVFLRFFYFWVEHDFENYKKRWMRNGNSYWNGSELGDPIEISMDEDWGYHHDLGSLQMKNGGDQHGPSILWSCHG